MALSKAGNSHTRTGARSLAQNYCLLAGLALLLAGIFGFFADATFDTGLSGTDNDGGNVGGALRGDSFLGFEVNGWHNVVHLLSGIVLIAAARKRKSAKTVAIAFGVVYGLVAIIGLIDGNDVLGLLPVNPADNILHIVLSALGIVAGLVSDADDRDTAGSGGSGSGHDGTVSTKPSTVTDRERITRDVDPLSGTERNPTSSTPTTRRT